MSSHTASPARKEGTNTQMTRAIPEETSEYKDRAGWLVSRLGGWGGRAATEPQERGSPRLGSPGFHREREDLTDLLLASAVVLFRRRKHTAAQLLN